MLKVLFWIIFGAIVGWIAAILQAEENPKRIVAYIVAGVVGGTAGGFFSLFLSPEAPDYDASTTGMMFAVFGATLLVILTGLNNKNHSG